MTQVLIVLAAVLVAVGAMLAVIIPTALLRRARRLIESDVPPADERALAEFAAQRPTFTMTVTNHLAAPPDKVWPVLENNAFSWIPMINGVSYADTDRAPGAVRKLDLLFFAAAEQVTHRSPGSRLSVTGIHTSIPVAVKSYTVDYQLRETDDGGTDLEWTIAGRPALFAFLPLSWTAVFIRPFARIIMAQLQSRL
ncbi:SRPBCC family protein [Nocardia sp. NPDC056100]|uniref:SRPBCC family protein n=1 Tax=Nocardia sp. NPDC056100 TaxID=3345712 RepID=UPI0035D63EFA